MQYLHWGNTSHCGLFSTLAHVQKTEEQSEAYSKSPSLTITPKMDCSSNLSKIILYVLINGCDQRHILCSSLKLSLTSPDGQPLSKGFQIQQMYIIPVTLMEKLDATWKILALIY